MFFEICTTLEENGELNIEIEQARGRPIRKAVDKYIEEF